MSRGTADWGLTNGGLQGVAEFDTYHAAWDNAYVSGTNKVSIFLKNPVGSGKLCTVHLCETHLSIAPITGDGSFSAFFFRTATAPVGGTTITPVKSDSNSPASVMQILGDLTNLLSFTGELGFMVYTTSIDNTAGNGRTSNLNQSLILYQHTPGSAEIPLRLRPGEAVALQVGNAGQSASFDNLIRFTERPL